MKRECLAAILLDCVDMSVSKQVRDMLIPVDWTITSSLVDCVALSARSQPRSLRGVVGGAGSFDAV